MRASDDFRRRRGDVAPRFAHDRGGGVMATMPMPRASQMEHGMRTKTVELEQDLETRDRLVMEHVGMVKRMASHLANRLPAQVELVRTHQCRRDRVDGRGRTLQAQYGRAVRRVCATADSRRHARLAARARFGAARGPQDASRGRRRDGGAAQRAPARARRATKSRRRSTFRKPSTTSGSSNCGAPISRPFVRPVPTSTASRCSKSGSIRARARTRGWNASS